MSVRVVHRLAIAVVLTAGLLVLLVPPAMACSRYRLEGIMSYRLGVFGFGQLPPGTPFAGIRLDELASAMNVITGITGDDASDAESRFDLRARCVQSYDHRVDVRVDATPTPAPDITVGSYAAIAGVAIPNSVACPGDLLIIFFKTPFLLPPQFLPSCLSSLPSAQFASVDTLELSDALAEGDEEIFTIFRLPFIVAYPVAYFVALIPSGSPITTPPLDLAVTVCQPTTDGAGRLIIPCTPL
jgi:hypothetical protein